MKQTIFTCDRKGCNEKVISEKPPKDWVSFDGSCCLYGKQMIREPAECWVCPKCHSISGDNSNKGVIALKDELYELLEEYIVNVVECSFNMPVDMQTTTQQSDNVAKDFSPGATFLKDEMGNLKLSKPID